MQFHLPVAELPLQFYFCFAFPQLLALPEPSNPAVKCEKQMELLLRDQILDLEDKLWAGTLGITKVRLHFKNLDVLDLVRIFS